MTEASNSTNLKCENCGAVIVQSIICPPDGWQLEDGRTVCGDCVIEDLRKNHPGAVKQMTINKIRNTYRSGRRDGLEFRWASWPADDEYLEAYRRGYIKGAQIRCWLIMRKIKNTPKYEMTEAENPAACQDVAGELPPPARCQECPSHLSPDTMIRQAPAAPEHGGSAFFTFSNSPGCELSREHFENAYRIIKKIEEKAIRLPVGFTVNRAVESGLRKHFRNDNTSLSDCGLKFYPMPEQKADIICFFDMDMLEKYVSGNIPEDAILEIILNAESQLSSLPERDLGVYLEKYGRPFLHEGKEQ